MTDLTQIKTPFGLLDKDTQQALRDWPHGLEVYMCSLGAEIPWVEKGDTIFRDHYTYRAIPAPKRVDGYVNVYDGGFGGLWSSANLAKGACSNNVIATFRFSCNPDGTDPQIERVEGE